jgi:hypothetical protein
MGESISQQDVVIDAIDEKVRGMRLACSKSTSEAGISQASMIWCTADDQGHGGAEDQQHEAEGPRDTGMAVCHGLMGAIDFG